MSAPIEIGSITIYRIIEQEGPFFEAMQFFPTMTKELLDENRGWLQPRFLDARDKLMLCIQSYIVKTPHHTIMIDSCVGNHKPRPTRSFWHMMNSDRYEKNLAASGFGVNDIDFVMCTHLHTDHVGWNTRLENGQWVPTFPKARYVFADRELAYWTKRQNDDPAACPWITDSVLPIVAANRVDIVKSAHAFNDLVTLIPTPGHTIDHYSVQVGKTWRRCRHYRRHDPLAAASPISGTRHDVGLRFRAGGSVEAAIVRPLLRYVHADVHGTLSVALYRSRGALEGCVRLHRRVAQLGLLSSSTCRKGRRRAPSNGRDTFADRSLHHLVRDLLRRHQRRKIGVGAGHHREDRGVDTRRPCKPLTRPWVSTTDIGSSGRAPCGRYMRRARRRSSPCARRLPAPRRRSSPGRR